MSIRKMSVRKMMLAILLIIAMTLPQATFAATNSGTEAKNTKTENTLQAKAKKGWVMEGGKLRYYLNSSKYVKKSWKEIKKKWFYFDKKGFVVTGWQKIGGKIYYLNETGAAGFQGEMLTGWQKIGKKIYYFEKSGEVITGWKKLNGKSYYFKKSSKLSTAGTMLTGWRKIGGKVYYLSKAAGIKKKGSMLTGWKKISNDRFYFNSDGMLQKGWLNLKGAWYYLKPTGEYGDLGKRLTGWQKVNGKKYYMSPETGKMVTGWNVIDGKDCYFSSSGAYEPNKKKAKKLIAIDAGHQKKGDSSTEPIGPGSSIKKPKVSSGTYGPWSKLNEYELNLIVAKKLEKELIKRGYTVYMIRTTHDVNISNSQRAKNAANAGADILVRIHANGDSSSSVYGALTMAPGTDNTFLTKANITNSRRLSSEIINAFCKSTGAYNRGVQSHNDMSGINWSTIPVTIVEMGFMTNKVDDTNMANAVYQDNMVKGMANGIDNYYK